MLLSLREANRQRAQDLFQAIQEQTLRQDQAQGLPEAEQRRDLSLHVSRQIGLREATDLREAAAATGLRQHPVRGETDLREEIGLRDRQAGYTQRKDGDRPTRRDGDRPARPQRRDDARPSASGSTVNAKPTQNEQKSYSTRIKREINSPSWTAAERKTSRRFSSVLSRSRLSLRNTASLSRPQ